MDSMEASVNDADPEAHCALVPSVLSKSQDVEVTTQSCKSPDVCSPVGLQFERFFACAIAAWISELIWSEMNAASPSILNAIAKVLPVANWVPSGNGGGGVGGGDAVSPDDVTARPTPAPVPPATSRPAVIHIAARLNVQPPPFFSSSFEDVDEPWRVNGQSECLTARPSIG
jgi:hypothetical protein